MYYTEKRIIEEGREARKNKVDKGNNPYRYAGSSLADLWAKGWIEEDEARKIKFPVSK